VALIVDGSSSWSGVAAGEIANRITSALGACQSVYIARFDADQPDSTGSGVDHKTGIISLPPRTPMKDAIAYSLEEIGKISGSHTVVVVAHDQFYPTLQSTSRLLSSAQQLKATAHTIHLESRGTKGNVFRRFGRALADGTIWVIEALSAQDAEAYSAGETASTLNQLAQGTGGKACIAIDRESGIHCANAIADQLKGIHNEQKR
jgi:hypothetical protein